MRPTDAVSPSREARFGTFGGVFTPNTLTILGVIMFLRFGVVVGHAGVWHGLVIVALGKAITLLTALSLSAIATNTRVRGGGAYYLISRSLGVEYGSAIGIVFYIAQAVSVAMYVIGFAEAIVGNLPGLSLRNIATIVNIAVLAIVFIGAGWTIKVQYLILATLGLSLLSFYAGAFPSLNREMLAANWRPNETSGVGFFAMFALFFPAVTGIMAGANMSGDLRNPGRSIPRGTLAAIGVTGAVYASLVFFLGGTVPSETLVADTLIMKDLAWIPPLITVGVLAATLSSALGSMMGAPRILQAFARDGVFPRLRLFARGSGPTNEPRIAILLTFVIAQAGVMLGDLNLIAPIITMFFLITYGMLNLATFLESFARNPSWRPRFRYSHWSTALLGTIGCVGAMFLIAPGWALASIVAMAALQRFISRREIEARWGDVHSGALFERARRNLLRLEAESYHPKNWRPIILALSTRTWSRPRIALYGHWLTGGRGILSIAQVIVGEGDALLERRANQERLLRRFIRRRKLSAFPVAVVAPSLPEGIRMLIQCHGLGGLRPNTVLLRWQNEMSVEEARRFTSALRTLSRMGKSIVAIRCDEMPGNPWVPPEGTIDVWWRGRSTGPHVANGPLMLLLAHLLAQNEEWRARPLRILQLITSEAGCDEATTHLNGLLERSRIKATPVVVVGDDIGEAIRTTSARAAVVFVGFPRTRAIDAAAIARMDAMTHGLKTVIFVDSAGGMELEV